MDDFKSAMGFIGLGIGVWELVVKSGKGRRTSFLAVATHSGSSQGST